MAFFNDLQDYYQAKKIKIKYQQQFYDVKTNYLQSCKHRILWEILLILVNFKYEQIYFKIIIVQQIMLASRSTSVGKSTNSSKLGGSLASSKPKKDNFFLYAYKRLISLFSAIWGKTRKTMWIFSTGFILLILPFTFAYISQFQKEAAKIMGANDGRFM